MQNPVLNSFECFFVANQKAVCVGLKYVEFHLRPDRSRSENGGPATYLAAKIQQEGTSKRRKTSKGFYRKTYDYIKAYSPAYDLIREHMNDFLAYNCDVTQTLQSQ